MLQQKNESDYVNLLVGIQNIQLEMMNTLKLLEENVSIMRHEISMISMKEQQEEVSPISHKETKRFFNFEEEEKDDDDSFKSEINICIIPDDKNVSFFNCTCVVLYFPNCTFQKS